MSKATILEPYQKDSGANTEGPSLVKGGTTLVSLRINAMD